ncbi:MAG: BrnT family toxin [Treponema sp.]|nr:BrnT family toxin [Treponema sp.]
MGKTIISPDGRFEWDEDKNKKNLRRHGVSFEEILEVFDDPAFLTGFDYEHSDTENRYYGVGNLTGIVLILVFFTERGQRTRIISARQADAELQEAYNDYFKKIDS